MIVGRLQQQRQQQQQQQCSNNSSNKSNTRQVDLFKEQQLVLLYSISQFHSDEAKNCANGVQEAIHCTCCEVSNIHS
jgi:hypothetical protein